MESAPRVLVVGGGLAGLLMVAELERRNLALAEVWSARPEERPSASSVAAGMFNPVSFRRLVPVWDAERHMAGAEAVYRWAESLLSVSLWNEIPLFKIFPNSDYADLWQERLESGHPVSNWIEPVSWKSVHSLVNAPFGGGWVPRAGYVDLGQFISRFHHHLQSEDRFHWRDWSFSDGLPVGFDAVIDCRGVGAVDDLKRWGLDVRPNHGEVLTLTDPEGTLPRHTVNRKKWLLPLSDGETYRLGATYRWDLREPAEHPETAVELLTAMNEGIQGAVKKGAVVAHKSGVRPASPDRRPMVGKPDDQTFPWYHLVNGLGTRGVLVGPRAVSELASTFFEKTQSDLHPEVICQRFRTFKAP